MGRLAIPHAAARQPDQRAFTKEIIGPIQIHDDLLPGRHTGDLHHAGHHYAEVR